MFRLALLSLLAATLSAADQFPLVLGPQGQPQQILIGDTLNVQLTSGLFSALPTPTAGNAAMVYWATDTNLIYRSNGSAWTAIAVGGSGTVSSVGLALPGVFSVTGSPVTGAGTLSAALTVQSPNAVWAGPISGGAAQPTFRALVSSDIPSLPYGTGTVTSVSLAMPSAFTVAGSPVATAGGFTVTYSGTAIPVSSGGTGSTSATPYALLAGGTSSTGAFQSLASTGTAQQILTSNGAGSLPTWQTPSPTGVTSVGLSLPGMFTVTGSPVTGSGTLTGTLATQSANTIFAGPTTGSAAAPTFRALVTADIPSLSATYVLQSAVGAASGVASLDSNSHLNIAQAPSGLMNWTAVADAAYSVSASDYIVGLTSITASRIATLPTSSGVRSGHIWTFIDASGSPGLLTQSLTWTVTTGGTDTLNGVTNGTVVMNNPNQSIQVTHDGAGHYYTTIPLPNVQIFTANGTWTKPRGASMVNVVCIGGGGGGGSGGAQTNATVTQTVSGGGGGGSGGISIAWLPSSVLTSTVSVTVGATAAGGVAVTQGPAGQLAGNNGTAGNGSTFGTMVAAQGGGGGTGGSATGGTGAGGTAGTGQFVGATGATGTANSVATTPTTSPAAAGAGGGGVGMAANGGQPASGGNGGASSRSSNQQAGGAGAVNTAGAAGSSGFSWTSGTPFGGSGGGGGFSSTTTGIAAGKGGNGGNYGAGGGGGAGALDATNTTSTSGAGGIGAQGIVVVISQ